MPFNEQRPNGVHSRIPSARLFLLLRRSERNMSGTEDPGIEGVAIWGDFSARIVQAFFMVNPKGREFNLTPGQEIRRKDLHDYFGGRRQGRIGPSRRIPAVFIFTNPAIGRRHGYYDGWGSDGHYHYVGEGQRGDQNLMRGNGAIARSVQEGRQLLVFKGSSKIVKFVGEFTLSHDHPYYWIDAPEIGDGPVRKVLVFRLKPNDLTTAEQILPLKFAWNTELLAEKNIDQFSNLETEEIDNVYFWNQKKSIRRTSKLLDISDRDLYAWHLEVKNAISEAFLGQDWFGSCGIWREGILINIVTSNIFVSKSTTSEKTETSRIMSRIRDYLQEKFDSPSISPDLIRRISRSKRVSIYGEDRARLFYQLNNGDLIANIYYSKVRRSKSASTHTVNHILGGHAIMDGNKTGTLATIVTRNNNPTSLMLLTNQHVLSNCAPKSSIYNNLMPPVVAIAEYVTGLENNYPSQTTNGGYAHHYIDAAICAPTQGLHSRIGEVARIGLIAGSTIAKPGMLVQKYGIATGLQHGEVVQIAVDTIGIRGIQRNVIEVRGPHAFQKPGDSGSLLVTRDLHPKTLGLMFSNSPQDDSVGYACEWEAISQHLQVTL